MNNRVRKTLIALRRVAEVLLRSLGRPARRTAYSTKGLVILYRRSSGLTSDRGARPPLLESLALRLGLGQDQLLVINDRDPGSSEQRPGFQRMLRLIAAGEVAAVIVDDISRISRDPRQLDEFYSTAWLAGVLVLASLS